MVYKRIYFVDVENIGASMKVEGNDLVYLFTSKKAAYRGVLSDNVREIYVPHESVKDALDFVIDSWLGYTMMHYGRGVEYIIKSRDNGFGVVVDFWSSKGYNISLDSEIQLSESEYEFKKSKILSSTDVSSDGGIQIVNNTVILNLGISDRYNRKVTNVYKDWGRSKKLSKSMLKQQLSRVLGSAVSKQNIAQICETLYQAKRG